MIQRKQHLFLAAIFLISLTMIIGNMNITKGLIQTATDQFDKGYYYSVNIMDKVITFETETSQTNNNGTIYSLLIVTLIAFITIFLFKKREIQLRLVAFNFLFIVLFWFNLFFSVYKLNKGETTKLISSDLNYLTLSLPLILLVLNFLALKGIKKDIELLASVNRFR